MWSEGKHYKQCNIQDCYFPEIIFEAITELIVLRHLSQQSKRYEALLVSETECSYRVFSIRGAGDCPCVLLTAAIYLMPTE
jgi:hypothetical protein